MAPRNRIQGKRPLGLTFWGQWLIAMVVLNALLVVLTWLKVGEVPSHYRILCVLTVFCSLPIYTFLRVYDRRRRALTVASRIAGAWLLLLGLLAIIAFITKSGHYFSREVLLQWSVLGAAAQMLVFVPLHVFSRRYHSRKQARFNTLVIGDGDLAQQVADILVKKHRQPLAGLLSHGPASPESPTRLYPVIGTTSQLRPLIARHNIKKIYIALPVGQTDTIESLYVDLLDVHVDVIWVPDVSTMILLNHSISEIGGILAIHLNESPLTANPSAALLKAVMDRVIALTSLVALSPLLLLVAIAVKLSSPGPVFFKQPRHGWNGQVFHVYKFRSMYLHEPDGVKQATRNDSRITKIGRIIRPTFIDELPQLINVLKGDMSLVGPRPHAVEHNDYYSSKIQAYMKRHRVKPGLTGLAQISGAIGETDTLEKMEKRVQLDLQYINTWSLLLDIKILLKTPLAVFGPGS